MMIIFMAVTMMIIFMVMTMMMMRSKVSSLNVSGLGDLSDGPLSDDLRIPSPHLLTDRCLKRQR